MAKLKVWGCALQLRDVPRQQRVIVAANSRAQAARILRVSDNFLRDYASVTGNALEIAIATNKPGAIFHTDLDRLGTDYKEYRRVVGHHKYSHDGPCAPDCYSETEIQ